MKLVQLRRGGGGGGCDAGAPRERRRPRGGGDGGGCRQHRAVGRVGTPGVCDWLHVSYRYRLASINVFLPHAFLELSIPGVKLVTGWRNFVLLQISYYCKMT
jgi:hypothetical protein